MERHFNEGLSLIVLVDIKYGYVTVKCGKYNSKLLKLDLPSFK